MARQREGRACVLHGCRRPWVPAGSLKVVDTGMMFWIDSAHPADL